MFYHRCVVANQRYQAQLVLPEIGIDGQAKLAAAKVLCVGCGGLAASVLPYLVAAGVGEIMLLDDDIISLSNLNRQILFTEQQLGEYKAKVLAARLTQQNPTVQINWDLSRFNLETGLPIVADYDLVLDCSDDYATKLAINFCCAQLAKPWVYASVLGWDGQVALFSLQNREQPCYKCWQIKAPQATASCSVSGVLGAAVNIVGSYQASLALQALLDSFAQANRLFIFDLWTLEQRQFELAKRQDCAFHGDNLVNEWTQPRLNWAQLANLVNVRLIDIRTLAEWERGHLPAAEHLTIGRLIAQASQLFTLGQTLVIYCNQQSLSLLAVENLRHLGLQAFVLNGGYQGVIQQIQQQQ